MFRLLKYTFPLLLLVVINQSCTVYKEVEVTEVLDVKLTSFSMESMSADVFFQVNNPNWYKLKLKSGHIDLFLEGKKIAVVELDAPLVIPKKMVSTQQMKIVSSEMDAKVLLDQALTLLFKNSYELQGTGYVKGKALMIGRKVPVDFKEKLTKKDLGF